MKPVLLSDIGNVLLHVRREKILDELTSLLSSTEDEIYPYLHDHKYHRDLELGTVPPESFITRMLNELETNVSLSVENLTQIMAKSFVPNRELFEVIEIFRPEFRVILLSNTNAIDIPAIEQRFGLLDWADGAILSHEVHVRKPDPQIYKLAMEKYDLNPAQTVFIDDLPENVEAAGKLGFQAAVYESPEQVHKLLAGMTD